jgi:cell division protein FtsQ
LVAAGFWTAAAAGRAPELAVSRIRVEGNQRLADGEILEALDLRQGANILNLDLEELKQKLLRSPWIKDVQLTRMLPATLTLRVVERRPLGVAVLDRLYLMDEDGTFLDELGPRYADLTPPLVRGLNGDDANLSHESAALAGRVLGALASRERLLAAVSEVDVSEGPRAIRLLLRNPPLTVLLAEDDLIPRLAEMLPLTEGILERFPYVEAVDLRFEGRVYLRLQSGFEPDRETDEPRIIGGR